MIKIRKRDNTVVDFDVKKIEDAIEKAFINKHKPYSPDLIEMLAIRVLAEFNQKIKADETVTIEDVQDAVEDTLIKNGFIDVAKSYIIYRKQHEQLRQITQTQIDYKNIIDGYLKINDWSNKSKPKLDYSVGGLILSNSGAITANYWLSDVYDKEIEDSHNNADINIHNLSMLTGFRAGWSLRQLICQGLGGVDNNITASPATHLSTLCNQMANFLMIMQNEWADAQSFTSVDTYLAPYVKIDKLTYKEVKQCIQAFVYSINTPTRWGTKAPFTVLSFDWTVPEDMKDMHCIVGGKEKLFRYKECEEEMAMINKAFLEVLDEGDGLGRRFAYPIPVYSISKDFTWEEDENTKLLFTLANKYGIPHFSNYASGGIDPLNKHVFTEKLRLDLRELRGKTGGFYGYGEFSGSIGLVSINMPRIAYIAVNKDDFFSRLDGVMDIAARSLKIKRNTLSTLLEAGLYPYTKYYLGSFKNYFSTIGVVGLNEVCSNARWLKNDISDPDSIDFIKEVLGHMRQKLSDYQEQYGDLFNLETTIDNSTSIRFAEADMKEFPDIMCVREGEEKTPNYSTLYIDSIVDPENIKQYQRVVNQIHPMFNSGTLFDIQLYEKMSSYKACLVMIRRMVEECHIPFFTVSPRYSICDQHGYYDGEHYICPRCDKDMHVYVRKAGIYRAKKAK